jgi:paired amphipathic helix protein Sin3a
MSCHPKAQRKSVPSKFWWRPFFPSRPDTATNRETQNRFQDKPEIYKQFLEILQTYQREQKPIQDVYSQVTSLFHTAPDLLEDFKQFLPESAAQTRSVGQRPEENMPMAVASPMPQPGHAARDGPKMPPVGNFAPPASASKESKKRRPEKAVAAVAPTSSDQAQTSALRGTLSAVPSANKRAKLSHKPSAADSAFIEPTLTPVMPEPLGPTPLAVSAQDDFAFFEKVKKHIGNRTATTEFLKLLNLWNQDLITKDVLIYKANQFMGGNPELLSSLRALVKHDSVDEVIENRPEPPTGRVSLSNCRGFGPSYRLLPKRERLKPCSGRDELCQSVLNDEWASHPTWASEDSGFVAHRKNGYEEGLHRIEEERHDYDFYIEANQKCIQLLEPIAQQMLSLPTSERANFKMPAGLGGQSTSIYKRVLKKIYGPEKGCEVANDMFKHPFTVVPVVMARLKQKDEEWRFTQVRNMEHGCRHYGLMLTVHVAARVGESVAEPDRSDAPQEPGPYGDPGQDQRQAQPRRETSCRYYQDQARGTTADPACQGKDYSLSVLVPVQG